MGNNKRTSRCDDGCNPQTDDTAIDCNGIFHDENCVSVHTYPYLNIAEGSSLTEFHTRLIQRLKSIVGSINNINNNPIIPNRTPLSETDPFGVVGQMSFDNSYLYVKTNVGWKKTSLTNL